MNVQEIRTYRPDAPEPQPNDLTITWPDEREGWSDLTSPDELAALLAFYDLPPPDDQPLPATLSGEQFTAVVNPSPTGYRVLVRRRPHGPVQEAAWRLAEQTAMYRIIVRDGSLGVLFRDENIFVPVARLAFDHKRQKFRLLE
jgi:hypothetical protein